MCCIYEVQVEDEGWGLYFAMDIPKETGTALEGAFLSPSPASLKEVDFCLGWGVGAGLGQVSVWHRVLHLGGEHSRNTSADSCPLEGAHVSPS